MLESGPGAIAMSLPMAEALHCPADTQTENYVGREYLPAVMEFDVGKVLPTYKYCARINNSLNARDGWMRHFSAWAGSCEADTHHDRPRT